MRRDQVASGDAVYSCNCGFIDRGHANPGGARALWNKIAGERHEADWLFRSNHTLEGHEAFIISYSQGMGTRRVQATAGGQFLIRRGLNEPKKREVALAIFVQVSLEFEAMQGNAFWGNFTNSGFSPEDLMSNLIGFHRALDGHSMAHMERLCGAVSRDASLAVFDANLAGRDDIKVREFFRPRFFTCKDCPRGSGRLPELLTSIRPSGPDGSYIRLPGTWSHQWRDGAPLDFDRSGRVVGQRHHRAPESPPSRQPRGFIR